jgi:alpha-D-ribose 1-methylphosphonate 5-triphosphate synthase subunit PhnH
MDVLTPAFREPVTASQAVFRAIMEALARPGEVKTLAQVVTAPSPLSATAAAVALALLDYETPLWLDSPLAGRPGVAEWIRFHTGARVTADPRQASFAIIADTADPPSFDRFALGTAEYPDRSTTLVLQVERFESGQCLSLSGPGVASVRTLSAEPLPPDLHERLGVNHALFPRGVDLILVSRNSVAALPRSVVAQRG